jgi:hypothetical protein
MCRRIVPKNFMWGSNNIVISHECGDEPSGSGTVELVRSNTLFLFKFSTVSE